MWWRCEKGFGGGCFDAGRSLVGVVDRRDLVGMIQGSSGVRSLDEHLEMEG